MKITNEDNMELMARYPDKYFDLAIVDPPYGIGESKSNFDSRNRPIKQKNGAYLNAPNNNYARKEWDSKKPDKEYFLELKRVSKHQIVWGVNYFNFGFGVGRIVWDKCNGSNEFSDAEIAYQSFTNSTRLLQYMWSGMFQGKSIKEGHIQQGNKKLNEKRIHPTQKPVKLYEWLLINYAKEGDKILDTHLGSGSIAIACHNLGFDLTACELDKEYFDAAIKRINEHKQQLRMF